jgi:uncharacterized protein involved in exopolysaccharide biosynthesis
MTEQFANTGSGNRSFGISLKEIVAIGFRHKRVMGLCFFGILAGVVLSALLLPAKYRAETKLLLKRARVDPIVTAEQTAPVMFKDTVDEEEINSEIELIQSRDVLQQVVEKCHLNKKTFLSAILHPLMNEQQRLDKSVNDLRSELQLEVVKKTNVISIAYESPDPKLAQNVLETLNTAYLAKHTEVSNPSGQLQFFEQQTEQYKKGVEDAENQLKQFASGQGTVAPTVQRDMMLQKLADFQSSLDTTRTSIQESKRRIAELEGLEQSTPSRMTTSVKKGENAQLMQTLKGTLLNLEIRRTELLTKYQPTYPLVQEVDKQLADTRALLAKEEAQPTTEETTDQNPTYGWVASELAKAKADLSGYEAREKALQGVVNLYLAQGRKLEDQGIVQEDLKRMAKVNEDNYVLYMKKREEARIDDALNRNRILNVAVAQNPVVPALPTRSPWIFGLVGCLLASAVSVGVVFLLDYSDQSFRTPAEVISKLGVPVLAAVPEAGAEGYGNGHSERLVAYGVAPGQR